MNILRIESSRLCIITVCIMSGCDRGFPSDLIGFFLVDVMENENKQTSVLQRLDIEASVK